MTAIHDLLDAVSTGQPQLAVSVDSLVRQGRRHQRAVASGLAAATAGVVAVIGLAITQPGAGGSTTTPSSPLQTAAAKTSPYSGAVTSAAVIPAAHLFGDGTTVGTYLATSGCATPAFTVVSQDAERVVLSLKMGGQGGPARQKCVPFPSSGTSVADPGPSFSGEVTATLQQPLGTRHLIDAATNRSIPVTADTQAAEPSWLPRGWRDVMGVQPADLSAWSQVWQLTSPNEQLSLTQRYQTRAELPGTPNETVGTSPARLEVTARRLVLTWFSKGRLYILSDGPFFPCKMSVGEGAAVCPSAAVNTPRVLTKAELLRIAISVTPR